MGEPKTVREWLLTLPLHIRQYAITKLNRIGFDFEPTFKCIGDALSEFAKRADDHYWYGVRRYIKYQSLPNDDGNGLTISMGVSARYIEGFNAAKAAFEAQKPTVPEVYFCIECENSLPVECFTDGRIICDSCHEAAEKAKYVDSLQVAALSTDANHITYVGKQSAILPDGTEYTVPVGYIAVAPNDLAEMQMKAQLYNEVKAVIERLSCEIEDLKKLFV